MKPIIFADLWSSYPSEYPYIDPQTGNPPRGYENQCAIKVSTAIYGAGATMKSFKGATVSVKGNKLSVRAEELAGWLKLQPFCGLPRIPQNITGADWQTKIKGKTGIVFFKDYWTRSSNEKIPSGDHIDLWNESKLTPGLASFWRFTLGISSFRLIDLSDLGKSTEILFWEIK